MKKTDLISSLLNFKVTRAAIIKLAPRLPLPQRMPSPSNITIEISTNCNLSCTMCSRTHSTETKSQLMGPETYENVLDNFPKLSKVFVCGAGEPLLHPDILEIIKITKSRGASIIMTTNAALLTEKMARDLVKLKLDTLYVSLDGATTESYEKIRRGAKFDRVIENIKRLDQIKQESNSSLPAVELNFVGMSQNINELPGVVELAHELGLKKIYYLPVTVIGEQGIKHPHEVPELTKSVFEKATEKAKFHGISLRLRPLEPQTQPCFSPWSNPYISIDGTITPCCPIGSNAPGVYASDWYFNSHIEFDPEEYVLGDIFEEDFSKIWNNKKYRLLRKYLSSYMREDSKKKWDKNEYFSLREKYKETEGIFSYCRICPFRFQIIC